MALILYCSAVIAYFTVLGWYSRTQYYQFRLIKTKITKISDFIIFCSMEIDIPCEFFLSNIKIEFMPVLFTISIWSHTENLLPTIWSHVRLNFELHKISTTAESDTVRHLTWYLLLLTGISLTWKKCLFLRISEAAMRRKHYIFRVPRSSFRWGVAQYGAA